MRAASRSPSDLDESILEAPERRAASISGVRAILSQPLEDEPFLRDISVKPEQSAACDVGGAVGELEEFSVEFPLETQFFAGLTRDLSCGGLFVATYRMLPIGTSVRVRFELADGVRVEAQGDVRWIREQDSPTARRGLAIAFVDISTDALRHISEFCLARPPLFLDL